MVDEVEVSYDRISGELARRSSDWINKHPREREVLDHFQTRVKGLVCDLGCGCGHVARYLYERGMQIIGIDQSDGMLKEARKLSPGIQFLKASMRRLPVADGAWGGIVGFFSLCHIPRTDIAAVLTELRRTLQPSGLLLLSFHLGFGTFHRTETCGKRVSLGTTMFLWPEIKALLVSAGFKIEAWHERQPYGPWETGNSRGFILGRKTNDCAEFVTDHPALLEAILYRSTKSVKALLTGGVDSDTSGQNGWTALHVAASDGRLNIVDLLLRRGASIDRSNNDGANALHIAARGGHSQVVVRLVEAGANPAARDTWCWGPISVAAF